MIKLCSSDHVSGVKWWYRWPVTNGHHRDQTIDNARCWSVMIVIRSPDAMPLICLIWTSDKSGSFLVPHVSNLHIGTMRSITKYLRYFSCPFNLIQMWGTKGNIAPGVCPLTISDLVTSYCFILLCLKMVTINLRSIKIRWQAATQLVCMRCMMNQTPWDCFKIQFCSWNDLRCNVSKPWYTCLDLIKK